MTTNPPTEITEQPWLEHAGSEAWIKARKIIEQLQTVKSNEQYQNDPVGFGEIVLGESYTDDAKRVMESVRDNTVTIARSATDVGKSHCAARLALWFWSCFPDSKTYITAAPPLENLKQILWGEIAGIVHRKPTLVSGCRVRTLGIYRHAEHFITGVAIPTSGTSAEREAKFSGKHSPYLLFIIDEGDAVPDEVYKGIEGCMSGGTMVRLLIMFNPRAKIGPVYEKERLKQANVVHLSALRHPNVLTGDNIIPGAVTRDVTVRRINMWTRPLMEEEPKTNDSWEIPEFLVGVEATGMDGTKYPALQAGYRHIEDPEFWYMVLGLYPPLGAQQLINEDWIDNAISRRMAYVAQYGEMPPAGVQPKMGVDLAEFGPDYNMACFRYGGFVGKFEMWGGVDTDRATTIALEKYIQKGAIIAYVDGTGIGASVAPSMSRQGRSTGGTLGNDVRAVSVKVSERPSPVIKTDQGEFRILRDQLWWALREWLRTDPGAMLPNDSMLKEELMVMEYDKKNGKIEVSTKKEIRKKLKRSPDRADALCLTFAPFERAKWTKVV